MGHYCLNPRDRSVEDSESRARSHDVVLIRGKGVHSNVRYQSIEHRAFLRTQYNTCIDQDTDVLALPRSPVRHAMPCIKRAA